MNGGPNGNGSSHVLGTYIGRYALRRVNSPTPRWLDGNNLAPGTRHITRGRRTS